MGARLGGVVRRDGGDAVHLLPAGGRLRVQAGQRGADLRPRTHRHVPAGDRQHLRPALGGRPHLRRSVPSERGGAVEVQLPGQRSTAPLHPLPELREGVPAAAGPRPAAARIRLLPEVLARLQPARRARRDQRHRAAGIHPAGSRAGPALRHRLPGRPGEAGLSHLQGPRDRRAPRRRDAARAAGKGSGGAGAQAGSRSEVMDLVFEIGCEELPAGFLKPALEWMAAEMNRALDDARLNGEGEGQRASIAGYATPRRLALVVTAIAERAPDVRKLVQGPPAKAAFQDGKPTKAAEGFARKVGVPVTALRVEGDRVVVEQQIRGLSAAEALPAILERMVRGIPFKKSMRWDSLDKDAFARPVHWISALLEGKPLAISFADVKSGATTRGHRFHAPKEFPVPAAKKYVSELRAAHVLADWAERKQRIWEEVQRGARDAGGEPLPDDDLLETVTGLVEEPSAVTGHFDEGFLELPPEVLVSEMRGHQKYFSVQKEGKLLPAFVAVSNTRVRDPAVSRRGYERVLRARLSDGKFFFDEDRKLRLVSRVERLGRRTFMDKLGTELERVERLRELSLWLHGTTGKGEPAVLRAAAELCKADLTTGMVGEFPELQGAMGRIYAQHDGEPGEVAEAIFEHYLPRGAEEKLPRTDAGALLGMADRLDLLAGVFGIGKEPSGTADPYGLRRAALGLLRITLARRYRLDLREALLEAQKLHTAQRGRGANNRVSQDP